MAARTYCEETGRPIVDRVTLLDYTGTSTKKSEPMFWVNVRLRWADLRITEAGRVPKRGEALVLFVMQGPSAGNASKVEWLSTGRRIKGGTPGGWHVASMRVLRNLAYQEQNSSVLMASAGGALLRIALSLEPRRVVHVVRPPSFIAIPRPPHSMSQASV
ncbi:unnamed protein product [Effrenium voratum]|nr:unnamed protein product [Effrenium voratum]